MAKRKGTRSADDAIEGVDQLLPLMRTVEIDGLRVSVEADLVDGRLECTRLVVEHVAGGPPVTSEALRRVPVRQLVSDAVPSVAIVTTNPPEGFPDEGPNDEALRYVATLYRWALATGQHPTQAVEWASELPRATVGRWIAKAREKGYLGPAEAPGKSGG